MAGLQALEYRGYDSAGLTLLQDGGSESTRAVGPLKALRERVNGGAPDAAQRHRPHPLGHPRARDRGQLPSPRGRRRAACTWS